MQKDIERLYKLQKIDTALNKLEKLKGGLPKLISELGEEVAVLTEKISTLKSEINDSEKELKETNEIISDSAEILETNKSKRQNVTNNKEYEAITAELEYRENLIVDSEEKKIKLGEQLEKLKAQLEELSGVLAEKEKLFKQNKDELELRLEETKSENEKLLNDKEVLEKEISTVLLRLYKRIYNSKNHLAVVPTDKGYCEGCFTVLPSQKISEIKRTGILVQCDVCSRILVSDFVKVKVDK